MQLANRGSEKYLRLVHRGSCRGSGCARDVHEVDDTSGHDTVRLNENSPICVICANVLVHEMRNCVCIFSADLTWSFVPLNKGDFEKRAEKVDNT